MIPWSILTCSGLDLGNQTSKMFFRDISCLFSAKCFEIVNFLSIFRYICTPVYEKPQTKGYFSSGQSTKKRGEGGGKGLSTKEK